MRIERLTRYPVKSMAGESLELVEVGHSGLVGDREWAVYDMAGKLASGKHSNRFRRMDPVFELTAATVGEDVRIGLPGGQQVVAGEAHADLALSDHFGEEVEVQPEGDVPHQDAGQVSLVGTATLREMGRLYGADGPVDMGSLRANVLVETDEPFVEETWVGREVSLGDVRLAVVEGIERCRMVDIGQVGVAPSPGLLKSIGEHRATMLGVYAEVVQAGVLHVGDDVTA
jgi:uncharacterized protein YcbX